MPGLRAAQRRAAGGSTEVPTGQGGKGWSGWRHHACDCWTRRGLRKACRSPPVWPRAQGRCPLTACGRRRSCPRRAPRMRSGGGCGATRSTSGRSWSATLRRMTRLRWCEGGGRQVEWWQRASPERFSKPCAACQAVCLPSHAASRTLHCPHSHSASSFTFSLPCTVRPRCWPRAALPIVTSPPTAAGRVGVCRGVGAVIFKLRSARWMRAQ